MRETGRISLISSGGADIARFVEAVEYEIVHIGALKQWRGFTEVIIHMSKTQAEKFADRYKRKETKPVLTFSLQVKLLDEKLAAITEKMLAIGNKHALYAKPAIF